MYRTRRRSHRKFRRNSHFNDWCEEPVWPLPALGGDAPHIVSYDEINKTVDLDVAQRRVGSPDRIPVFALKSGVITSAYDAEDGLHLVIDHRNGYSSAYVGLTETFVRPAGRCRKPVRAGDLIGYISQPLHGPHRTLRFTLFEHLVYDVPGFPIAFDPRTVLSLSALQTIEGVPLSHFSNAA